VLTVGDNEHDSENGMGDNEVMLLEVAEGGDTRGKVTREFSYSWETSLNSEGWRRQTQADKRNRLLLACDFTGFCVMIVV
jgi:hypothetical protein